MKGVMLVVDAEGIGVAIVDGKPYGVRSKQTQSFGYGGTLTDALRLTFTLTMGPLLDEEQQRGKIARLEAQLIEERERLDDIRRLVTGEQATDDR